MKLNFIRFGWAKDIRCISYEGEVLDFFNTYARRTQQIKNPGEAPGFYF